MYTKLRGFCLGVMTVWMMSLAVVSYADDTEIYFARADVDNEENKPRANVMIMLDTSGSMRNCASGTGSTWCTSSIPDRRINMLEDAIKGIINNTPESINIGLGRFVDANNGEVLVPVVPVNDRTKPSFLNALSVINPKGRERNPGSVSPSGGTPTARAYAEMGRYMLGLEATASYSGSTGPQVQVCAKAGDDECAGFPRTVSTVVEGPEVCGRWSCTKPKIYVSPVNKANQCESNHIILFTDGRPSNNETVSFDGAVSCSGSTGNYTCQTQIASRLNSEGNSLGVKVYTHNIGLYMGETTESNMKEVSDAGDGATHDSDSAESLLNAFLSTIDLIDAQSRSISAPGVAVNTMNRFQHLDELYYAVFQPAESSFWEGNLKRYKLVDGEIRGAADVNAIDASTGFFSSTAQDIWGDVVDGADATKGGARSQLSERKLFYSGPAGVSGVGATSSVVWANASNPNLSPKDDFFDWPADVSITRANMFHGLKTMWADPMHSVPLMVNYGEDQNYVFVSTNGGMLHIIDTSDGSEVSAFMPYEMMRRAPEITSKPGLDENNIREIYGLDASWVAWRKPGEEVTDGPEAVYIYGGMRRGGRHFYALDVTTPASPSLKWQINAGDDGFKRLGQTWSTPTLIKVPTSDGVVPALIFGGGYSPADHDGPTHTLSAGDAEGNTIYIVNAENGDLLWSATHAEMKWAVPGGVSVVDINFDGVADHLYFGDLGGQIFRVDMEAGGDHSVHRIANLGRNTAGSSENGDQRRFYEAPAVAYVKSGAENHLYIVAASGYRAHPLDEVTNEGMFVIFDEDALYGTTSATVTLSDMANVSGVSPAEVASDDKGWYYLFKDDADRSGEKALSSPVVFDNKILLSTYAPVESEVDDNPCAVRYGAAFLHTVELRTGKAASILKDAPDDPDRKRSQGLSQSTPPPTPTLLVDEDGNLIVVVGTEVIGEGDLGDPQLRKRRWMQLPKDEAGEIRMRGADGGDEEADGDGDGEGG
ncbi:MAG: hypothetical protein GX071_10465 [Gammaproteobacteria bacterium]|nr:hypothetical protein [Gammaproteobacteria bacterium]